MLKLGYLLKPRGFCHGCNKSIKGVNGLLHVNIISTGACDKFARDTNLTYSMAFNYVYETFCKIMVFNK